MEPPSLGHRSNWLWAQVMARSFGIDVLACTHGGGRLRLVALIEDARVVQRILSHLGLPTQVPAPGHRGPPPLAFPHDSLDDLPAPEAVCVVQSPG